MRTIKNNKEYETLCSRIEELLLVVGNNTSTDNKNFIELELLSDMVVDYEEIIDPIKTPNLIDIIKLRMHERGLNQKKLSKLLNLSTSRISEFLSG